MREPRSSTGYATLEAEVALANGKYDQRGEAETWG